MTTKSICDNCKRDWRVSSLIWFKGKRLCYNCRPKDYIAPIQPKTTLPIRTGLRTHR